MKQRGAFVLLLSLALSTPTWAATQTHNPIHPLFKPLDAQGVPVQQSLEAPDTQKTCGACHDVKSINAHQSHAKGTWRLDCARCHWPSGKLPSDPSALDEDGRYTRAAMNISAPSDATCASCHMLGQQDTPVAIPENYAAAFFAGPDQPRFDVTAKTGAIFSADALNRSFINLADKETHSEAWDAHARRLVGCIACHYAPNNPMHESAAKNKLPFLAQDPRRLSFSAYLREPDHRLAKALCESCHLPQAVHDFLPFKNAHLRALDCQSCHAPRLFGPALKSVDATVLDAKGLPLAVYRGIESEPGETLNSSLNRGYTPFLLAASEADKKFAPYNIVTRIVWLDAATNKEATPTQLRAAYFESEGSYAKEVLRALDANKNGFLSREELRLDTPEKQAVIAERLKRQGLKQPQIMALPQASPIAHSTQAGAFVTRRCADCHDSESRLNKKVALADFVPPGATLGASPFGTVSQNGAQQLTLRPARDTAYVVGNTPLRWVDTLGFALFVITVLGATAHGGWRILTRKHRPHSSLALRRAYLYGGYERLWHWLMAVSILILMVSGFAIHTTGAKAFWALSSWVSLHHLFALILTINAALSLFYHLATRAITQFLPPTKDLPGAVKEQIAFYLRGIFLGQPHPTAKTQARKMNPLQQLTYLGLLNVLFPFQLASGALLYLADAKPQWIEALGGLATIGPLHTLGSWLFLSFFAMHLYLTTTGHTPLANIRAMVTGFDEIEDDRKGGDHA